MQKLISLAIISLIISCGSEGGDVAQELNSVAPSPDTKALEKVAPEVIEAIEEAATPTSRAYLTESDAPACNSDLVSNLIYISSTDSFLHCNGSAWASIDMEPEPVEETPVTLESTTYCNKLVLDDASVPFFSFKYTAKKYSNGLVFVDATIIENYSETNRAYDSVQTLHVTNTAEAAQGLINWIDYNGENWLFVNADGDFEYQYYVTGVKTSYIWSPISCE